MHTCTYQGRSSTLHCLRICEWKNGLTHLADQQDFLRFFLRGLEEVIVCLSVCLLVRLSVLEIYLYISLISLSHCLFNCPTIGLHVCVWLLLAAFIYSSAVCLFPFVCLSSCLFFSVQLSFSICLPVCLHVNLSVCLSCSLFDFLSALPVCRLASRLSVRLTALLMFVSTRHFIRRSVYSVDWAVCQSVSLSVSQSVLFWKNRQCRVSFFLSVTRSTQIPTVMMCLLM